MVEIGAYNTLVVNKLVDFGLYLDGHQYDEILLPKKYFPENIKEGDELDVFIYLDSEDRLIATTEKPFAIVGECAYLKVVQTNSIGAFLDWGLVKDLFVPFREQATKMIEGNSYCVKIYVDNETQRIVASSKINKHLDKYIPPYSVGDEVDILVESKTDLGYKVIVDNNFWGLVYNQEAFNISIGDSQIAFVRKLREDGKLDISLQKIGFSKVDQNQEVILQMLRDCNGFLPFHDKSPADEIQKEFGMSKKTFKMVIGTLYKAKKIIIENQGIKLL